MIIVIDGYNILKSIFPKTMITESQRRRFIATLSRYAKKKHNTIIIVFDGGESPWVYRETILKVQVIYSGTQETADDYIKNFLKKNKAKDLLLVSSDHELNVWASQLSIPSISGEDYYILLQETLDKQSTTDQLVKGTNVVKMTEDTNAELDRMMQEEAKEIVYKNCDITNNSKPHRKSGRKLSKQERKLMQKIKKL